MNRRPTHYECVALPTEPRKLVQKILGKRGALVVAPTHILEPEVPWENVLAFVDAARHSYYE